MCHSNSSLLTTLLVMTLSTGCTAPVEGTDAPVGLTTPPAAQARTIEHLSPRRDSAGGVPAKFEWTKIEGADRYTIGLWNEVDVMLWRQTGITGPSVQWPAELTVEPGTYYWSVAALRDERVIAESGLAAFVVRE